MLAVNYDSLIVELTAICVSSLISIGLNVLNIRSNRAWAKQLKRDEYEAKERRKSEDEYHRLVKRNTRMLDYLKWSGYFSRYRDEGDGGPNPDWDA